MPRTRRHRSKSTTQATQKSNEFGITRGGIENCVETLRHSKYRWITNFAVIVTTASEVSAKFLHELANCLGTQEDPEARSIDNVRLHFRHSKRLTLGREFKGIIHESIQSQCYSVHNGEIIDMPDNTVVVFPLK